MLLDGTYGILDDGFLCLCISARWGGRGGSKPTFGVYLERERRNMNSPRNESGLLGKGGSFPNTKPDFPFTCCDSSLQSPDINLTLNVHRTWARTKCQHRLSRTSSTVDPPTHPHLHGKSQIRCRCAPGTGCTSGPRCSL